MNLYQRHIPKTFDNFIGNEGLKKTLLALLNKASTKVPHCFLFEGDYGTGKTTLANLVTNYLQRDGLAEVIKIDAGTDRGVADADELKKRCYFQPLFGDKKVFIIDEVQTTSSKYQESLLKVLENPPSYVYFIFCTTDREKINVGIVQRCIKFRLVKYTIKELIKIIDFVLKEEGVELSHIAKRDIAFSANGSPRNALTALEKYINNNEAEIEDHKKSENIKNLYEALIVGLDWRDIVFIIESIKEDPEYIRRYIVGICRNTLLKSNIIEDNVLKLMANFISKTNIDKNDLIFLCAFYKKEGGSY